MKQFKQESIGKDMAIALYESGWWKETDARTAFLFQINTAELSMQFSEFQRVAESALNRPVWTHEFAHPQLLMDEFNGASEAPTLEQILNLIPADKRVIVNT